MSDIICPICKSKHNKYNLKKLEDDCRFMQINGVNQHLIRYQCDICDVIFGSEDMLNLDNTKLSKAYQDIYLSGHRENDATSYEIKLFNELNPSKNGIYINWGSGTSSTSDEVKKQGYTLYNYDPGIPKSDKYISIEELKNMKVNGIISNNVLDHLQNPISDLLFMKSILTPDASMIHASDGFVYITSYTKFHLFFFVGKSIDFISKTINMKYSFVSNKYIQGSDIIQWTNENS